jgi:hypothetical protein
MISLGLLLLIGIQIALVIAGVFTGTESTGARVAVVVLTVLAGIVLLIGVFVPLSIIGQFALREIVVGREGIVASIGGGYRLFRRNVGRSLLIWLIQLALTIGAGIALLIAALLLGFVLFLPAIILAAMEYFTAAIVAGIVAGMILLPVLIVATGPWEPSVTPTGRSPTCVSPVRPANISRNPAWERRERTDIERIEEARAGTRLPQRLPGGDRSP